MYSSLLHKLHAITGRRKIQEGRSSFEHLPTPTDAGLPPICVPYLGRKYNGSGFFTFPESVNIDQSLLLEGSYQGMSPAEAEAFLQAWLFFGLIVEAFRAVNIIVIQENLVYRDELRTSYVTTRPLEICIHLLQQKSRDFTARERMRMAGTIREMLEVVELFAKRHVSSIGRLTSKRIVRSEVGLSIVIAAITIENAIYQTLVEPIVMQETRWHGCAWFPIQLLKDRLLQSNLCPATVHELQTTCSADTQYYISCFGQPLSPHNHSACTATLCRVGNIEERTYTGRHVDNEHEERKCEYKGVKADTLRSILQTKSGIPVVLIKKKRAREGYDIELKPAAEEISFIAISHVWSQGMGNPFANSLPECVLAHLYSSVMQTLRHEHLNTEEKRVALWIDTLCVPVGPGNEDIRRVAILRMHEVYSTATRVLVVDNGLRQLSVPRFTTELRLRILLSEWYRRLWTLQEGVLAHSLCVIFRNGVANLDRLEKIETEQAVESQLPGAFFASSNLAFDSTKRVLLRYLGSFKNRSSNPHAVSIIPFAALLNLLAGRKTSKPEDESICLAVLLEQPIDSLLHLSDHEARMKEFFTSIGTVPPDLMFYSGPKLSYHGLRWAPRSFLGSIHRQRFNTAREGRSPTVCDVQLGLKTPYPVLLFQQKSEVLQTESIKRIFLLDVTSGTWLMVTPFTLDAREHDPNDVLPLSSSPLALVIRSYVLPESSTGMLQSGALVCIHEESKHRVTSAFMCLVDARELNGQHDKNWAHRKWPFLDALDGQAPRINADRAVFVASRRDDDKPFWVG